MIFVSIGTSSWKFDRLIKEIDKIAPFIDEEIIMQIGDSEYEPKNTKYFCFKPKDVVENLYKNSRIVISHAGIGSIISAMKYKKPLILVPRRRKYNELLDDHQAEIAEKLENTNVNVIWDVKELKNVIELTNKVSYENNEKNLSSSLKDYLKKI